MEASVANLWRPLGEILIEWGLLHPDQLQAALAEQRTSGKRLGEVLVDSGLVPREVLVSVLLEQCGLEEETQQGFGSGLLSELRKRGSAHRAPAPLQVIATPIEEAVEATVEIQADPPPGEDARPQLYEERRRPWRRRKADRDSEERQVRVAEAFAKLETWTTELQREIVDMRRMLGDASR